MNKQNSWNMQTLFLRKTLYMIRFPSRSLDEAEKLQGSNRLSKPSSEPSLLRISYYVMKWEITRANYSNQEIFSSRKLLV